MGATAVRQAEQILGHVEIIVAIELLSAAQGIDLRRHRDGQRDARLGKGTAAAYNLIRQSVPVIDHDVTLSPYIEEVRRLVATGKIKAVVELAVEKIDG